MSADPDEAYASDDYELESPMRLQDVLSPSAATQQQEQTLHFRTDDFEDDASDAGAVTPLPTARSKRSRTSRGSDAISGRHLMDNMPWTYTVTASQVRMLRIPVAESAAVRELRVFATLDKQPAQSRGSRWKQEITGGSSLQSSTKSTDKRRKSRGAGRGESYRRSGLIEEAKWVRGDGRLQWTFPMEKIRRLKAYAPRVKAFVYGIGEAGVESRSRAQMENLASQEKDGAILSFGWFFLDLRTPDLPERWLKLQNSPFGGEILISTTLSPRETARMEAPSIPVPQKDDRMMSDEPSENVALSGNNGAAVQTMVSGEGGEYLQIGDSGGQEIFVLSVFIQEALNLSSLVEAAIGISPDKLERTGFWLSYSLFDVVVQTDVFYNLGVAEFSPIRDSFRVKSNVEDLARCIDNLASLTVFLCTENRVLAGVEISLRPLLSNQLFSSASGNDGDGNRGSTAEVEGKFSFPDFDDAVVTASVAVECIESNTLKTEIAERTKQGGNEKQITSVELTNLDSKEHDIRKDNSSAESEVPKHDQVLFKLDHVCFKKSIVAPFADEEGVSIEVIAGNEKVTDILVFCTFTKLYAFATSPALGLVLNTVATTDTAIRIRCFSSGTNRLVVASSEVTSVIRDDEGYPTSIVFPMLDDASESVGQCMLMCTRGSTVHQILGRELLSGASSKIHHYRMCLRLKSVRDIELPGGYSLRYQNPFLKSVSVKSDWFNVQSKGEVDTLDFYCMFDLTKDPLQLKQEMQETVAIDLISADDERVGSAIFSLSYLFFSEEHFCCSEDTCEEVFITQEETEAHWLEVHTESKLPDTEAGPDAYSHSYRSCSINIPIVSVKGPSGTVRQERVGSIRVSAYLEDAGLLTESTPLNTCMRLLQPPPPDKENSRYETKSSSSAETTPVKETTERSNITSMVREAEETIRYTTATRASSMMETSADNSRPDIKNDRSDHNRELQKEATAFRESLERKRSAWKQEQQLQQLQWKRRFAEMEKARMDELEEEWARREEERSNLLKSAQEEYQRLEQTLRKSLAELETRERRLAVSEAALQREHEAKRDEAESLQRRLKNEQSHTLSLAKKQTEAYERRIALLESQLSEAERRAKQVETDFAEYRQQQRKLPESRLREEIAALKGNVAELEKQKMAKEREYEIAEANIRTLKTQLEHMSNLLVQEKKKQEAQAVDELEKLRVKYIAREERYVLDGDRDELRAIKKQLDDLKGFKLRGSSGTRNSHRHHHSPSPRQRHAQWHTQSRQAGFTHQTASTSQRYGYPGPSSRSNHASGDESDWGLASFVEIGQGAAAHSEFSPSQSPQRNHYETPIAASDEAEDGEDDFDSSIDSYEGQADTELGRLIRERKLLLSSGAYDAQSYLVRELDRLIRVTKANADHRTSVA